MAWPAYIWLECCLILAQLQYIYHESFLILASVLFTFRVGGLHFDRVVFILGLVLLDFAYDCLGWHTCGEGFVYVWLSCLTLSMCHFNFGVGIDCF